MARNFLNDFSFGKDTSQFVGGVDYGNALDKLDAKYEQIDEYTPGVLDTLTADSGVSDQYKQYVQSQMELASGSNPYEANRIFKRTIKNEANFRADRNHVFGATQYNKNMYATGLKENEEVKTDQSIKDLKHKISLHNYNKQGGVGEYDPVTGKAKTDKGFNTFNFKKANEAVDEEDIVSKYGTGWASNQTVYGGIDVVDGGKFIYKNAGTKEYVSAKEVASYVYNNLTGNNNWLAAERDKQELNLYRELISKTDSKGNPQYSEEEVLDMVQSAPEIDTRIQQRAWQLAAQEGQKRGFVKTDRDLDLKQTRAGELSDEEEAKQLVPPQTVISQVYNNPNAAKDAMIPDSLDKTDFRTALLRAGYTAESVGTTPNGAGAILYRKGGKDITEQEYKAAADRFRTIYTKLKEGKGDKNEMHSILREEANNNPAFKKVYSDYYQAYATKQNPKQFYEGVMKLYNSKIKATTTLADTLIFMDAADIDNANKVMLNGKAVVNQSFYNENTGNFENANTFFKRLGIDLDTEKGNEKYNELLAKNRMSISNAIMPINDKAAYQVVIDGKAYRMTGTLEQEAEMAPVIQAAKVLSQGLDKTGSGLSLKEAEKQGMLHPSIAFGMDKDGTFEVTELLEQSKGNFVKGQKHTFDEAPIDFTDVMGMELPDGQRVFGYAVGQDAYDDPAKPTQVVKRDARIVLADDIPFLDLKKGQILPLNWMVKQANRMSITKNAFNIKGKNTGNQVDLKLGKGTQRTTN